MNDVPGDAAAAKHHNPTRAMLVKTHQVDAIVEPSTCVRDVIVTAFDYDAPAEGALGTARQFDSPGTVRVHPDAEILFERGNILSSNADLAVVVLDIPLDARLFPVFELTDVEARVGDRVTFVGYGMEPKKFPYGKRRSGENRVTQINMYGAGNVEIVAGAQTLTDGGFAAHINGGDSGGGCFKADDNKVLVGVIASRAQDAQGNVYSVMTSVYAHRLWLLRQIAEAPGPLRPEPPTARGGARDGGTAVPPAARRVVVAGDAGVPSPHPDAGMNIRGSDAGS